MKHSRTLVVAVALVVVVGTLSMAVTALPPGSASGISLGETVSGESGDSIAVSPGETVTVQVWVNATAVRGYQTNITFDPGIAEIDTVAGSHDFDEPVANVNNDAGWVSFNQLRSGETNDPVLAEVTLTVPADATGTTRLAFVEADTKLSDNDGETVAPEAFNSIELRVDTGSPTPTDTRTPTETDTATQTETDTATPTGTSTATPAETSTDEGSDSDDSNDNDDDDSNDDNSGGGGGGGGGGAISPPEPSFSVISTSLNRTSVAIGKPVMVSGTVENDGDGDGTFEARVYDNGTATGANTTVEIPDGEQRQINLTIRFNLSRVHAVKLNTTSVGTVTVPAANSTTSVTGNATRNGTRNETAKATVTSTPKTTVTGSETVTATQTTPSITATKAATPASGVQTSTTGGSGPGFGPSAVVVGLLLLAGWLGYRREDGT